MTDRHKEAFREEAQELLGELEASLLELEGRPGDLDLVGRVFRALHTVKGSGAMFGFEEVAAFIHDVETLYDLVRNGKMGVGRELIDLTLAACDQVRKMINAPGGPTPGEEGKRQDLILSFQKLLKQAGGKDEEPAKTTPPIPSEAPPDRPGSQVTYRIRFRPGPDLFSTGTNPLPLLQELRGLGTCRIVAQTSAIPPLAEMNPEGCYVYWDIILTTCRGVNAIKDVFIFVEDCAEIRIDVIDEEGLLEEEKDYKKLGEILLERGDLDPADLQRALSRHKRLGEVLVEAGLTAPDKVQSALVEQQHVREMRKERETAESSSSVRVPAQKLDRLVDLVGELVTVQARLSQMAGSQTSSELLLIAEEVERLTGELRDNTMSIPMLPIGTTFSKFKRLVRDLSAELGKEIELTTEGAETELDKTVIERLNDPLIHLIRNCIDHAIEPPEVRQRLGKPRKGKIHLSASHSGGNVCLQIQDDGAGLDAGAIRAKAREKGLLAPDADLPEKELFQLIFLPGFSTAKKVTSVSGRGVGMDVVKRTLDGLRGTIEVQSQRGVGTTISLRLPLTLAIIEGLLVKIGEGFFVIPLALVEECVEITREEINRRKGRHLTRVREDLVPYILLRDWFLTQEEPPEIEQIVVTGVNGERVGFVVDRVIGGHQTVLKNLGRVYRNVEGVSGATILGDGTVALILDVPKWFRIVEQAEKA